MCFTSHTRTNLPALHPEFKTQRLNSCPELMPQHHFMMDLKRGKHTLMPQGRKVLTRLKITAY